MASLISVLEKYSSMFGLAAVVTIVLSIGTVIFSVPLGSLVALMKISKNPVLKGIASVYVAFIRGTPIMVQIFLVFYGLPAIGVHFPSVRILDIEFSRLFSGLIALIINSTAYVCEIVRGGIQSIDPGQNEAARSLGFNKSQSMLLIIFPQAFKNILPAIGNELISVIKESSQVSVIGIAELMYTTSTIRGISYKSIEPLIIVSLIYFIITFIVSMIIKRVEKKLAVSNRS